MQIKPENSETKNETILIPFQNKKQTRINVIFNVISKKPQVVDLKEALSFFEKTILDVVKFSEDKILSLKKNFSTFLIYDSETKAYTIDNQKRIEAIIDYEPKAEILNSMLEYAETEEKLEQFLKHCEEIMEKDMHFNELLENF